MCMGLGDTVADKVQLFFSYLKRNKGPVKKNDSQEFDVVCSNCAVRQDLH